MEKDKTNTKKNIMKTSLVESNRIQELEKQVRILQIVNAYLKELWRLYRGEKPQEMKRSKESSTASKENSN